MIGKGSKLANLQLTIGNAGRLLTLVGRGQLAVAILLLTANSGNGGRQNGTNNQSPSPEQLCGLCETPTVPMW